MVKEMSYFHLTRTQGRKTCGSKAQRDGGVASKNKVPLSTTSVLISLVPWNLHRLATNNSAGGAENSYFAS